jgi:hypothetical protein
MNNQAWVDAILLQLRNCLVDTMEATTTQPISNTLSAY